MGFLKFCCIKLIRTLLLLVVVVIAVIASTYLADWVWGIILFLVIAYIFLRCWWEEYEKKQFLKRE